MKMDPAEAQAVVAGLGAPVPFPLVDHRLNATNVVSHKTAKVNDKPPRKKPAALTPKSMELLREEGYTVAVVEKWNPHVGIRQDMLGFIDLMCFRRGEVLAVQVGSNEGGAHAAHRTKIANSEHVGAVRESGTRIELHSWRKVGNRWQVRREDLS